MCHGQILSTRIQRSRTLRRCPDCRQEIHPGDERYVQVQKDGAVTSYECCLRCAAQFHAFGENDSDGCSMWDRDCAKEQAQEEGWREFRRRVRESMQGLRERFGRRANGASSNG